MVKVTEDGESVDLEMDEALRFAEIGLHFTLCCAIAGKTTKEVLDELLEEKPDE